MEHVSAQGETRERNPEAGAAGALVVTPGFTV